MVKEEHEPRDGDTYLLFTQFPFDFLASLPLEIALGVYLSRTPHAALRREVEIGDYRGRLGDILIPGYSMGGGVPNSCFWIPTEADSPHGLSTKDRFFVVLNALRLQKPLNTRVAGTWTVSETPPFMAECTPYNLRATFSARDAYMYSAQDMQNSGVLGNRVYELSSSIGGRFASGAVFFNQVSSGQTSSFQLAYLGLFASLEALFAPTGKKARSLGERVSQFLQDWDFGLGEDLSTWLEREYKKRRSSLAHGVQDVVPWSRLTPENEKRFRTLHEVVRLALLGVVSLDDDIIGHLSNSTGRALQNGIRSLPVARGRFLEGQTVWP